MQSTAHPPYRVHVLLTLLVLRPATHVCVLVSTTGALFEAIVPIQNVDVMPRVRDKTLVVFYVPTEKPNSL